MSPSSPSRMSVPTGRGADGRQPAREPLELGSRRAARRSATSAGARSRSPAPSRCGRAASRRGRRAPRSAAGPAPTPISAARGRPRRDEHRHEDRAEREPGHRQPLEHAEDARRGARSEPFAGAACARRRRAGCVPRRRRRGGRTRRPSSPRPRAAKGAAPRRRAPRSAAERAGPPTSAAVAAIPSTPPSAERRVQVARARLAEPEHAEREHDVEDVEAPIAMYCAPSSPTRSADGRSRASRRKPATVSSSGAAPRSDAGRAAQPDRQQRRRSRRRPAITANTVAGPLDAEQHARPRRARGRSRGSRSRTRRRSRPSAPRGPRQRGHERRLGGRVNVTAVAADGGRARRRASGGASA